MSEQFSRRDLLKWFSAGAGAATIGAGAYLYDGSRKPGRSGEAPIDRPAAAGQPPVTGAAKALTPAADVNSRVLVVVDFEGGNDGMSMLAPYGMPGYYDLRPNAAVAEADVLGLDDEVGFHPALSRLHARGAAVVQGVGSRTPDGSHFEMRARWSEGSPDRVGVFPTGFLGRLADVIGDSAAPAVAVALSGGSHPSVRSGTAATMTITSADAARYLTAPPQDDLNMQRFQRAYRALTTLDYGNELIAARQQTMTSAASFADAVGVFENEDTDDGYRDDDLGNGLRLAAHLFGQDLGVRIIHVTGGFDFDTHDDHAGRYGELMKSFDESLEAFMTDIEGRGLADRVLVATVSEFGRTLRENGSGGLDHGNASHHLLIGPVIAGRYGEHPAFDDDSLSDLPTTVGFEQYYAAIAEGWFEVPASEVLNGNVEAVTGMFA